MSHGYNSDDSDQNPLNAMWYDSDPRNLAPPCGCERGFIDYLLSLASIESDDCLLDLGAGDGRVCRRALLGYAVKDEGGAEVEGSKVEMAGYSVGVEIEADVCQSFRHGVGVDGLSDKCVCIEGDLLDVDFSRPHLAFPDTTVIAIYLLPEGLEAVEEKVKTWLLGGGDGEGGRGG